MKPEAGSDLTRRSFLRSGSCAAAASLLGGIELVAQQEQASPPASALSTVNCAVVGLGSWGREILTTLARLPQAKVVAICDTYPRSLRRASVIAGDAEAVDNWQSVLANREVRAVIVSTPSHRHREVVLAALQAGKHVYCEAPMATTADDARAIALAAKKAAPRQHFQVGLQARSDPLRHLIAGFFRAGTPGKSILARAQWNKKTSWRVAAESPERSREANWRLDKQVSLGLAGEVAIHHLDSIAWFLNQRPIAINGFGAVRFWSEDAREVHDTIQLTVEFPDGMRFLEMCTLASSFDSDHEVYYGTDAAVLCRGGKAWLFREADAPLLGWEVHARKETFHKETGLVLVANASKQKEKPAGEEGQAETPELQFTPLHHALAAFIRSAGDLDNAVEDFVASYGSDDAEALRKHLETVPLSPGASYREGFESAVVAIKAQEAVRNGSRIEVKPEWFELA